MKKNICFWSRMLIVIAVGLLTLGMVFCETSVTHSPAALDSTVQVKPKNHSSDCDKERCRRSLKPKKEGKDSTIQRRINNQQTEIKRRLNGLDKKLTNRKR